MKIVLNELCIFLLIILLMQNGYSSTQEDYDELMQRAFSLRKEARFEEAEKIYSRILEKNPDDVDALVGRGFCFLHNKDLFKKAEEDFQEVIDKTPSYVDAYYGLALIYKRSAKWNKAREALEKARGSCAGDEEALRYLSDISWQISHFPLARSIDKEYPPTATRKLKEFYNEIYLNYTNDWVKDRPDWYQAGLTYVRYFRPDFNANLSFTQYRRYGIDDSQIGLGLNYRYDMNFSFEYQGYFSINQYFLAGQKHHPIMYYNFPSSTLIGLGVRLDKYETGWAKVGRFEFKQYMGSFYGEYSLYIGKDDFNRSVTTHIVKVGFEKENKIFCYAGYSNGDETVEPGGGTIITDQLVETVFINLRYFLSPKWGIFLAGGPEYRDKKLFRTTIALSLFVRF
ncbi:MAG: YaiO family outer membrane beta-barrel protein [Candidatus Aminicenantes bacterium]|nr:MAG: YaiO family outer membrane beta-barrel protein [Candidatus Aminicenantes bacterium]